MNIFQLTLFVSLNPKPPCFIIPVFTTSTSNQSFAQDLLPSGRIGRFVYFDPGNFTIVPAIAPVLDRRLGEAGTMAFWLEDDVVLCGTADHLRTLLTDTGSVADSPFVEVERATFLEDDALIEDAAGAASDLLVSHSAQSTYLQRVKGRVKVMVALREQEVRPEYYDDEELNAIISFLENEKSDKLWFETWVTGWRQFAWRQRLFDVARWRIMSAGLNDYEYLVLRDVRYNTEGSEQDLFRWWLDNRSRNQPAWALIWMFSRFAENTYPIADILKSLSMAFDARSFRREQWPLLTSWSFMYSSFSGHRPELERIAESNDGRDFYSDYFIESIVLPIHANSPDNKWAKDRIASWLKAPSGVSLWIRTFLRHGSLILSDDQYQTTAIYWLKRFGKGTNSWFDLYERIKHRISPVDAWNLRISWLRSARKDLYSWPAVFESLADDAGSENFRELSEIARTWTFRGRSSRRNTTIEEFANR